MRFLITCIIGLLLLGSTSISRGNADERNAARWVEEVKQIVRSEGNYGEADLSDKRFSAGRRIVMLDQLKSPAGVAGLIEIITDPGFIKFDDQHARDETGGYRFKQVVAQERGLRLYASWLLYNQPLVDEASLPSIATDRSREWRRLAIYHHKGDELVEDCSAWCREVQAGRMTFQMKGHRGRYGRYGKAVSEPRSVRLDHRNEGQKNKETQIKGAEKETSLTWVYLLLGALIAVALGVVIKQRTPNS